MENSYHLEAWQNKVYLIYRKASIKPPIWSFYRNKKERSIFNVIESVSIVIVANKKTRSKNSSSSQSNRNRLDKSLLYGTVKHICGYLPNIYYTRNKLNENNFSGTLRELIFVGIYFCVFGC